MGSSTSVYIYANYLGNLRPMLPLRLSGSDRKRELAGIPSGSARFDPSETFLEIFDLTGKHESLCRGKRKWQSHSSISQSMQLTLDDFELTRNNASKISLKIFFINCTLDFLKSYIEKNSG